MACALVGSLGALYTGIVLANLALAFFALIAIESGSQSLGRAYAGLLGLSLILDVVWFCLFTNEIRWVWFPSCKRLQKMCCCYFSGHFYTQFHLVRCSGNGEFNKNSQ